MFNEIQCHYSQKNNHCFGGTHARTQGIARGSCIVNEHLLPRLQQTELLRDGGNFEFI